MRSGENLLLAENITQDNIASKDYLQTLRCVIHLDLWNVIFIMKYGLSPSYFLCSKNQGIRIIFRNLEKRFYKLRKP